MKTNMAKETLGKFEIETPIVRVSDPCYDKETWCAGTIDNCKVGEWESKVIKSNEGSWGERVAYLIAWHQDTVEPNVDNDWKKSDIDVGVDSGQAGIFDDKYFKDDDIVDVVKRVHYESICTDEPWYSICCDRTLCKKGAGVIPFGCVSCAGYGDGSYNASYIEDGHNVVAIMIDFGLGEEEVDEDDCCIHCGRECDSGELDSNGLCDSCHDEQYCECDDCGHEFDIDELEDGLCWDCKDEKEEEENES